MKKFAVLLLTLPVVLCTSGIHVQTTSIGSWQQLAQNVTQMTPLSRDHKAWMASIQHVIPSFDSLISSSLEERNVSTQCRNDMNLYNTGIQNADLWAMTMFDASAKIPESYLSGAFVFMGNFDQCLRMKKTDYNAPYSAVSNTVVIYIKALEPSSTFTMLYIQQACMPESCSSDDIQFIFRNVLFLPLLSVGAVPVVIVPADFVYTGENKPSLDAAAIVIIVLFSIIGCVVAIATLYDVFKKQTIILNDTTSQIVLSFSSTRNIRRLMDMTVYPNSISCLHGLRVLTLFWVMLGHSYSNTAIAIPINSKEAYEIYDNPWNAILYNPYTAVDTFFFLSGFLMCYVFMAEVKKKGSFNIFTFYAYRYLRLTAPLALVVGFFAALMPHLGYGPGWSYAIFTASDACKSFWWLTLIYINNYVRIKPDNYMFCIDQSWYLSVDMQLAWLSPLVLIPLWKWPKRTCQILLPLLIAASCFAPFTSTYINGFPMTVNIFAKPPMGLRYALEMYQVTHMRATPYLVGIAFAYFMIKVKDTKIEMKWWQVAIGWCISTGACLAIVFAAAIMYSPDYDYNAIGAAFHAGFHRLAWSISLAWIIFACTRGYAGVVNSILSWPGWLPLSRLSYCTFLLHLPLIYFKLGSLKTGSYFNHFGAIHDFFGETMMTILFLAPILHIFCEAPTLNLLRLFFNKSETPKTAHVIKKEED